ncbi:MAG: enoyl-CoA hydratase/isomerase family protein [Anaerolineales bacterium]|jgi:enoyl-CoA hydratase/carnithine racemase
MSEDLVQIKTEGEVAIVRLCLGTTNALGPDLIARLADVVQRIRVDSTVRGLVLTSHNDKFFSIGFDLPHLMGVSRADFATFFRAFNLMCLSLYTLPKPTAAAISGHATAGGCIVTLCCDYRLVAGGRKLVGLNEIKLGVPVPYAADCILRETVGSRIARDVVDSGEFYTPDAALELGLVDEVLPMQDLVRRATERIQALASIPSGAFAAIKRSRTEVVEREIRSRLDETDRAFVDCWYSQAARERLKEAMGRF